MPGSFIIDARHRLRWHQRFVSEASTTMMWGAWLKLWGPVLSSFAWLAQLGVRSPSAAVLIGSAAPTGNLEYTIVALAGASGTLLMWKELPSTVAPAQDPLTVRDYARRFELPEDAILAGRNAAVCVVHHDDAGRIVRIECRAAGDAVEAESTPLRAAVAA